MNTSRAAYIAIAVSILLYGCELWALTAAGRRKLRAFHHRCVRSICGVIMWHVQHHEISNVEILKRASLMSIDTYMARRRLRWIGHVSRMSWIRVPRKLLSSWVYQGRPRGRSCMRWAESIEIDLNPRRVLVLNEHIPAHRTTPPHCELQCACKTAVSIAPGPAIVQ